MKRSEMISLLEVSINERLMQDYQFSTEAISQILSDLEEAGILPPLNEQNYHFMDNQSRLDANQIRWYHSWEDEE